MRIYKIAQFVTLEDFIGSVGNNYIRKSEEFNQLYDFNSETSNKEAALKWYDDNVEPLRKKYYRLKKEWEAKIKQAISSGQLTKEEAKNLGLRFKPPYSESEGGGWQPLPPNLYHVTTAKKFVISGGLKTRDQLEQESGIGLGGGESDTISLTDDLQVAYSIKVGLIEMKNIVDGRFSAHDMILKAEQGEGAEGPYRKMMLEWLSSSYYGSEKGTQFALDGYKISSSIGNLPDEEHNWEGVGEGWEGGDGKQHYVTWKRLMTEEELIDRDVNFYKYGFSPARENSGGLENPMFMFHDESGLRNIDMDDIAILEFKTMPNSYGYRMGAQREWRTSSGEVFQFIREIK